MNLKIFIVPIVLITILGKSASAQVWTLIKGFVQNNVAGVPIIHERTEWDFEPEQGKQRRARFESVNGKYGENLIERLGKGMGFKGPWGRKVSGPAKPDVPYA